MESFLRSSGDQLIWMAEYNTACIEELRKRIGVRDEAFYAAQQFLDSNSSVIQTIQEMATLELKPASSIHIQRPELLDIEDVLPGILWQLKERHISFSLNIVKMKQCNLSAGNLILITSW